jgi:2-C-methyl-D-erythritol 4-phosphate cytidylyltransferase
LTKENKPFVTAIILAAGVGCRMKLRVTKQQIMLVEESVLSRSVRAFEEAECIDAIVVVCREDEREFVFSEVARYKKVVSVVNGGNTRAESARLGFMSVPEGDGFVAIHDAARCLVTPEMIERVVSCAFDFGAATAAKKITDSIKRVDADGMILESVPREDLYAAQTPQVFKIEDYALGLKKCSSASSITDDNMIVESIGKKVFCVDCGEENLKITVQEDISYAEFLIRRRMRNV